MNTGTQFVEEPVANSQTKKAMEDIENKKGAKVKDSLERFSKWRI